MFVLRSKPLPISVSKIAPPEITVSVVAQDAFGSSSCRHNRLGSGAHDDPKFGDSERRPPMIFAAGSKDELGATHEFEWVFVGGTTII